MPLLNIPGHAFNPCPKKFKDRQTGFLQPSTFTILQDNRKFLRVNGSIYNLS